MKTLRIALFFIFGTIFTLHSFAQEVKKEKTAKIKMEVIDDDGSKKVIDTTFAVAADQDIDAIIAQIKKDAGFSEKEMAKMKRELKEHTKDILVDVDIMMDNIDKESIHKHLKIVHREMNVGKEQLKKALEELKVELESLKMNEKAMQKLEKAMEELKEVDWKEHTKNIKVEMNKLHEHFDKDENITVIYGGHGKNLVWVDDDGEKHIVKDIDIDGLKLSKKHKVVVLGGYDTDDQNVWVEKDGEKIIIKKKKGGENTVFFGDEADLEKIHEMDGEHKIILKQLKGEAEKGEAVFISDDAHVIKEFKDEDGNVKVMRYKMKSGEGEAKEMKIIMKGDAKNLKGIHEKMVMISPAGEKEIAMASEKGIFNAKAKELKLQNFSLNIDNEITTIGATFEKKGQLLLQIYDKKMNKLWEKNAGRVGGEWSAQIPADVLKESGVYYFLFEQGKKAKLMKLISH